MSFNLHLAIECAEAIAALYRGDLAPTIEDTATDTQVRIEQAHNGEFIIIFPGTASRRDWRASPLHAPSLAGLPPALVLTVAHDPLCDEGRAYAQRLDDAGVRVTALHLNDQTHGLLGQGKFVPAADVIGDALFSTIGRVLHRAAARAPVFSTPAADGRQQQPQETS
jgi:acetyl esterase